MCMSGYVAKATFLSVVTYWQQEKLEEENFVAHFMQTP